MAEIPTAREFYQNYIEENNNDSHVDIEEMLIDFAKLHVEAALKEASKKVTWKMESFNTYFGDSRAFDFIDTDYAGDPSTGHNVLVDKDSILNSYPLTNIK
jgi:hypothetical protein